MVAEEYVSRARLVKANRLASVCAALGLSGDDVRVLVADGAPVLSALVAEAEVRVPSAQTWELVAVLLEERARLSRALLRRAGRARAGYMPDPDDPFSGLS